MSIRSRLNELEANASDKTSVENANMRMMWAFFAANPDHGRLLDEEDAYYRAEIAKWKGPGPIEVRRWPGRRAAVPVALNEPGDGDGGTN